MTVMTMTDTSRSMRSYPRISFTHQVVNKMLMLRQPSRATTLPAARKSGKEAPLEDPCQRPTRGGSGTSKTAICRVGKSCRLGSLHRDSPSGCVLPSNSGRRARSYCDARAPEPLEQNNCQEHRQL